MPLLLVILFIVVPIAELALLIQVGQLIGVWWTIPLLIADALLGSWLLRTQSRAAWRRFNDGARRGADPAPRGRRRRAGDLRRRAAADAGLHHRHLRPAVPVPAHARAAARAARPPRRAASSSARCRARRARRTAACATPTTSRATPWTSTPTSWTRRGEPPSSRRRARCASRATRTRSRSRGPTPETGLYGLARVATGVGPDGATSASALAVAFAGREPLGAIAEAGDAGRRAELTATTEAPLERWTLRAQRRARLRARPSRRSPRPRSTAAAARPRQGRRDGGLRAALPRARHGRRDRRSRRAARPARALVGQPGLGQDRAHARASARGSTTGPAFARADRAPDQGDNHADEAYWGAMLDGERALTVEEPRLSHHDRRGRPPDPRGPRAVGRQGRRLPAARRRRGPGRLDARARRAAARRRVLRLAHRGPRRDRPLRHPAARVIKAVITDFGGVITLPLIEAFTRAHAELGIPVEAPRQGDAARRRAPPRAAAVDARARPDHRARVHRRARGRPQRGDGQARRARRLRPPPDGRAGAERAAAGLLPARCATSAASGSRS